MEEKGIIPNWRRVKCLTKCQRKKMLSFYAIYAEKQSDSIKAITELAKICGDYELKAINDKQTIVINVTKDDLKL